MFLILIRAREDEIIMQIIISYARRLRHIESVQRIGHFIVRERQNGLVDRDNRNIGILHSLTGGIRDAQANPASMTRQVWGLLGVELDMKGAHFRRNLKRESAPRIGRLQGSLGERL